MKMSEKEFNRIIIGIAVGFLSLGICIGLLLSWAIN
jgi:hypothetical protein